MSKRLIQIGGVLNLLAALFHLAIWGLLARAETEATASGLEGGVVYVLNNHVALAVFFFAVVSLLLSSDLLATRLGRFTIAGIGLFYAVRAVEQPIFMPETMSGLGLVLVGFSALVALLYWLPLAWVLKGSLPLRWGTTDAELEMLFPCDELEPSPEFTIHRGITVHAPPAAIWPWLRQLRVTSLSYGLGQRPPTAPRDELESGESVMDIFSVTSVEPNVHLTLTLKPDSGYPLLTTVVSYLLLPTAPGISRLLVKGHMRCERGLLGFVARLLLPWGDLIMMRKQLVNIKRLAEQGELRAQAPDGNCLSA